MAVVMLTCSRLKFIDMSLLITHVVLCIQTSDVDVFEPERSSPVHVDEIFKFGGNKIMLKCQIDICLSIFAYPLVCIDVSCVGTSYVLN